MNEYVTFIYFLPPLGFCALPAWRAKSQGWGKGNRQQLRIFFSFFFSGGTYQLERVWYSPYESLISNESAQPAQRRPRQTKPLRWWQFSFSNEFSPLFLTFFPSDWATLKAGKHDNQTYDRLPPWQQSKDLCHCASTGYWTQPDEHKSHPLQHCKMKITIHVWVAQNQRGVFLGRQ